MNKPSVQQPDGPDSSVETLLRERQTVQEWLQRLGEQSAGINPRVVERVRADYEERLERATQALAEHETQLRAELERQRTELREASAALEAAMDAVAEAQLRHLIGELEEEEWKSRNPELDAEAERIRDRARLAEREVERLEEILAHIAAQRGAAGPTLEDPAAGDQGGWEPLPADNATLEEPLDTSGWSMPARGLDAVDADPGDETDFLEDVDRALASGEDPEPLPFWDDETPSTPPGPGSKCAECGYTNDANALYCGVCGASLT